MNLYLHRFRLERFHGAKIIYQTVGGVADKPAKIVERLAFETLAAFIYFTVSLIEGCIINGSVVSVIENNEPDIVSDIML